jgi:hypothetical protein
MFAPMDEDAVITAEDAARLRLEIKDRKIDAAVLSKSTLVATYNATLQIDAHRRCGERNRAIKMLQKITMSKLRKAASLEIICTYIYYKDFKGALDRYQSLITRTFELDKVKILLEIHLSDTKCGDRDHVLNRNKMVGLLKSGFDVNVFDLLLDYTNINCRRRGCVGKRCFLEVIEMLRFVEDAKYIKRLGFEECCALQRYFDNPMIERQRILCNPWVSENDVFRYMQRCSNDLDLLAHVAERRRLAFLVRDKRLKHIENDAISRNMRCSSQKTIPRVDPRLFDDVRNIPKNGGKYFQRM